MECQIMANLLDNASNQPSKFGTKNWIEINDESRGTYCVNRQINFNPNKAGLFEGSFS